MIEVCRYGGYRRLLVAQALSDLGNWLTNVALILLIVRLSGYPAAAALVLLAKLAPRMLVYPVGGVLADRFDRRRLMLAADLLRAGLAASLLLVRSPEQLWWALAATALAQVLASLFNPAAMAAMPALVPAERLGSANALLSAVKEGAFFVGPVLGALAVAVGGVDLAFLLDAGTFLVSAALLAGLRGLPRPAAARAARAVRRDLAEGWATIAGSRRLLVLVAAQVLYGALIAALNVLLVPLLLTHWQASEELLGILYGAIGAGSVLGAVLALRLAPGGYLRTTLAMLGLIGVAALGLGLLPWLWPGVALLFVSGVATAIGDVASNTAIQSGVDDDRLGRVFGLLFWAVAVGQAGGAGLGWLAGTSPSGLLVAGLGLALVVAALLLAAQCTAGTPPVRLRRPIRSS